MNPQYGFDFKSAINQRVNNPFFNVLPPEKFPGGLRNQRTAPGSDLLKPYPHYGPLTQWSKMPMSSFIAYPLSPDELHA